MTAKTNQSVGGTVLFGVCVCVVVNRSNVGGRMPMMLYKNTKNYEYLFDFRVFARSVPLQYQTITIP